MTDSSVFELDTLESTNPSLLRRAKTCDPSAWNMLMEVYLPMIYARLRKRRNLSPQDAENVGQNVFVAVMRSLPNFEREREGSFRKWLNVITDNKCIDHVRKSQTNVAQALGGSAAFGLMDRIPDVFDELDDDEEYQLSEKALVMKKAVEFVKGRLKEEKWEIYWDVVVENRCKTETAKKFGVSIEVVYNTISRTNKKIKDEFENLIDDDIYPTA